MISKSGPIASRLKPLPLMTSADTYDTGIMKKGDLVELCVTLGSDGTICVYESVNGILRGTR